MKITKFNLGEKYRRQGEEQSSEMDLELSATFNNVDRATLFQAKLVELIRSFNEENKNAN